MIRCPNCNHQEINGALFCSECGTQLVLIEHINTQTLEKVTDNHIRQTGTKPLTGKYRAMERMDTSISLYLVDSGHILHLNQRSEYALGRSAEGQPIIPDIDLSPYDAYALGVSRLHASLKNNNDRFSITDLGSSNGTYINSQKIQAHNETPINNGDVITLGKLKLQVFFHQTGREG